MKKYFLVMLSTLMVLVFNSCNKEELQKELKPQEKQNGLCYMYTSTLNPACSWGEEQLSGQAKDVRGYISVGIHSPNQSDPMEISEALFNSFIEDRPTPTPYGYPSYIVGDKSCSNCHVPVSMDNIMSRTCNIAMAARDTIINKKMTVTVKTKNLTQLENVDYYMVVYVLEDNLVYPQNSETGIISNFVHDCVLRKTSSGNIYYGEKVFTGGAANKEFNKEFTIDVTGCNPNFTYALVVIYKKGNESTPKYLFENAFWTR
ncbi:MAG: Omp28-related outer membrane protein [Bacteroidales bacterium]|nr:Omp28-related outer membrane protein [Bacteroidales bacterium]MDD4209148.1 Omp28-related outer membrane protein [Bacteroidales bacterium]